MTRPSLDEREYLLAAELALGLLDGRALVAARLRAGDEPAFADAVARWEALLGPLAEEITEAMPPPALWERIERITAEARETNVVPLRRRLARWRAATAAMTAVAASLALLLAYHAMPGAPPPTVPAAPAPVMIATLSSPATDASLSVAYDRQKASLLVTPGRLARAPGHDHQLWIIPAGGAPVSLGIVRAGTPSRMPVPAPMARHFRASATLALSVEPAGGSPTGQPTGPVIATGALTTI